MSEFKKWWLSSALRISRGPRFKLLQIWMMEGWSVARKLGMRHYLTMSLMERMGKSVPSHRCLCRWPIFCSLFFNSSSFQAQAIASIVPGAVFRAAKLLANGSQSAFDQPNSFLNLTSTLYVGCIVLCFWVSEVHHKTMTDPPSIFICKSNLLRWPKRDSSSRCSFPCLTAGSRVGLHLLRTPFSKQKFDFQWGACTSPRLDPGYDRHIRCLPPYHPPTHTKTSSPRDSAGKHCLHRRPYIALWLRQAPPTIRRWTHAGEEARWAAIPAGSTHGGYCRWWSCHGGGYGPGRGDAGATGGGNGGYGSLGGGVVKPFSISGGGTVVVLAEIVGTYWDVAVRAAFEYGICTLKVYFLCCHCSCCWKGGVSWSQSAPRVCFFLSFRTCFVELHFVFEPIHGLQMTYTGVFFLLIVSFPSQCERSCPVTHISIFYRGSDCKRKSPLQKQHFEVKTKSDREQNQTKVAGFHWTPDGN